MLSQPCEMLGAEDTIYSFQMALAIYVLLGFCLNLCDAGNRWGSIFSNTIPQLFSFVLQSVFAGDDFGNRIDWFALRFKIGTCDQFAQKSRADKLNACQ